MANKQETKKEEGYKPGPYICIVEGEGFAFFNKCKYKYGDRVVVEDQDLVDKLMGAGPRFIPEAEFEKADENLVRKIRSASSNNKSVEDIVRATEIEKKKLKEEYEAQLEQLKKQLEAKEAEKQPAPKGDINK